MKVYVVWINAYEESYIDSIYKSRESAQTHINSKLQNKRKKEYQDFINAEIQEHGLKE